MTFQSAVIDIYHPRGAENIVYHNSVNCQKFFKIHENIRMCLRILQTSSTNSVHISAFSFREFLENLIKGKKANNKISRNTFYNTKLRTV